MTDTPNLELLRKNAAQFAKSYASAKYESGEAQSFIIDLCRVFGLNHRHAVRFEDRVKKMSGRRGRIDGFFPGLLLIEMKSAGEDLDKAFEQAIEYLQGVKQYESPQCILISDFQNLHLYDLKTHAEPLKIKLVDFTQYIEYFAFLQGYEKLAIEYKEKINKNAAEQMGILHDAMKATGYDGKDLERYLVRLLFCLFAENTTLLGQKGSFLNYLLNNTKIDGSDLDDALSALFNTLNLPSDVWIKQNENAYQGEKRLATLSEELNAFPYINGNLFEGDLKRCEFTESIRFILIECAELDWGEISPAIFGSLFQAVMLEKDRRKLGAHYTSEENILKAIEPLFMDDLRAEFKKCNLSNLPDFHEKLANLNFFDPACGCGNFLIIAYRELRLLEIDVIKKIYGSKLETQIDIDETLIKCNVHQFHGIDIDESAVQIATLAMWLTDHQMNMKLVEFGNYFKRIPLVKKANIVHDNALQIDWQSVVKPEDCSFIMGNPPFVGAKMMNDSQRADIAPILGKLKHGGLLDYVAAWYVKATAFIKSNPNIPVAFVSTNSITQGEQVGVLWSYLSAQGVKIHFAHRTFCWSNEGGGVGAAVHCVIIGFGLKEPSRYRLFDYIQTKVKNKKTKKISVVIKIKEIKATQINPYLVDAPTVLIANRSMPLCNVPKIGIGNKPIDGGNYLFTTEEKFEFIFKEPASEPFFKRWLGADEFLNGYERWCLWLGDISENELAEMPHCLERVDAVKKFRESSKSEPTRKIAETPTRFHVEFMPKKRYLLIPSVSSENRNFVPIDYVEPEVITSNLAFIIPNATLYHFGVLTSSMHNAWMRAVCGRLESRYRYSAGIVYNNFPFPTPTAPQIAAIKNKAQAVLDARAVHENATLAELYNPEKMPENLVKAHRELDRAVDCAFAYKSKDKSDAARVAFLFEKYQELTAMAVIETETVKKKSTKS